jgi:ubiquinol-cytochrome c reductase cytochrome b subunit
LVGGFISLEAKVWGVVLMGLSLVVFFLLPWLDRSPVKSIRYRGWMYKTALAVFVISFVILGYLGTRPPEGLFKAMAQVCTILYFAFFLLMPWISTYDKTKPVPSRVTTK